MKKEGQQQQRRFPTGLDIARSYADGKSNPVEVARSALAKAKDVPSAFLSVTTERALREAEASAQRWQIGAPLSALDGVPVAWKDLFDIAGTVTTAGSKVFSERPAATADAPLVASTSAAGLVCIGKTALSELAFSGLGLNPHFGTPTNPYLDRGTRAPGGSSSGSAIAVAMGIVPIAVGTDTAGSIRVPSALNGLTGYRASRVRYDGRGSINLAPSFDTIGLIAQTVADCVAFDNVLRGACRDSSSPATLEGKKFIVDPSLTARYGVTAAVQTNFRAFLEELERNGAAVEERELQSLADIYTLIRDRGWPGGLEAFALHRALLDSPDAERIDQRVRVRLEANRKVPPERLDELMEHRNRLSRLFAAEVGDATVVMPTVAHVAPPVAELENDPELFARVNLATLAITMLGSFLDTPAIAMRSGLDGVGLPTSVQLIRPEGDDAKLLQLGLAVEERLTHGR
ncbi:amidase [Paraburkholderia strydomiana]|nr:amidase [Paraburkholderia strydomiana]